MNPTNQFVVNVLYPLNLFGADISITNSSISMFIATGVICLLIYLTSRKLHNIPTLIQFCGEELYRFVMHMIRTHSGKQGEKYFSLVMSLFLLILFGNLLGLIPGVYTFTSQLIITLTMSVIVFLSVILIGLKEQGLGFFKMFVHGNMPLPILLFIIPIEIISFFARPVSLCLRLCINMIAGHMMLKIFATFAAMAPVTSVLIIPLLTVLTLFEILVAILQAYIFTMLTCIYLHDAVGNKH
jgi:F-type H+-transporting ATPase subunit a